MGLLELWPLPNFGGSGTRHNYVNNPPWSTDRDAIDGRIDHNFSDNDKVFGRFSKMRFDNLRDSTLPPPGRGDAGNDRAFDDNDAHSIAFSYTKILRPTLLNEFRYGFIRQKVDKRELTDLRFRDLLQKYGITGLPIQDRLFGLPRFGLGGGLAYEGLGEPGSMPNFKIHQVHQYLNNLSWNRGAHNFKFGADLRWNRSDIFGGASSHGNFAFDGNLPASALLTSFSACQRSSISLRPSRARCASGTICSMHRMTGR